MEKYRNLHLWMIIPLVVMQVGIMRDYWGDFTDNAWSVHIHYWTGAIWYLYLIIQPYYATHGRLERHRTNGIITPIYLAQAVIIGLAVLTARRYGKMNHPATFTIVLINVYVCFLRPLGTSPAVQGLLEGMIKG